ncbi:RicAFT regulatory complex protein RicA family protein [Paenibacillus hunanensis]|uniref:RicAFT regulatory complex protein RicA family protein n=1 Tax=Paenibacillus hunanensis TaxID=539262 RepID=UPI001E42378A|nr:YlbF family regulator [Paenibacillus hunanensis]MCL9660118.1 YlbF family regulator [Paenibacillus hunanensis]WPP43684.1 YlbF family regulator [Paenibacillus hunanensis]
MNNQQTAADSPELETSGLYIREDIMEKTRQLAGLISNSEEIIHFQKAEQMIQSHERVQSLISQIKKKQKEVVAFESLRNQKMVAKIEAEMAELQQELDDIPLVGDYQESQVEINDLLQMVVSAIYSTVSEKIHVESGKDSPPASCGD